MVSDVDSGMEERAHFRESVDEAICVSELAGFNDLDHLYFLGRVFPYTADKAVCNIFEYCAVE
jgi:hypothetical protein